MERAGKYSTQPGGFSAFYPASLPPDPPLAIDDDMASKLANANRELGRLDGTTEILPDTELFVYMYVRKEAVLSSQIEGTQSSLSDLLIFEIEGIAGIPMDDVQEVSNYVAAMDYGLKRLQKLPLSLRLFKKIHGVLLAKGRGSEKFADVVGRRRTDAAIGGAAVAAKEEVSQLSRRAPQIASDSEVAASAVDKLFIIIKNLSALRPNSRVLTSTPTAC